MSDKLIGKTLAGRFVLEELLGTGATGAVYRAQQTSVDRLVAVKTLHPFLQQREDFKARFEIEAKAIARLNHPNCITLYDFGYDEAFDVFYMAVEYIKGQQLADMMEFDLLYDDVLLIAYQVADALDHAHREGILHRDLKPENIMIQTLPESGRLNVKVLDFGLARLYEPSIEGDDEPPSGRYKQITEAGQVYGTPAYMSPEQCRAHDELTPATDIYALGTMLFELLEGHLPFFSKSTAELIMMQMTEEPPHMERIDVPPDIRELVFSMMQKDPSSRPQTAREVLTTLLPHVRLDASQEFRILPSPSGEFAQMTPEQIASLTSPGRSHPTEEFPVISNPDTLDLSDDELRSAQTSSRALVAFGLVALVLGFLSAIALASLDESGTAGASPATVDSAAAAVADSPAVASKPGPVNAQVEVAEMAEHPDKPAKAQKPRKKSVHAVPPVENSSPAEPAPDLGEAPPEKKDSDRPKTLKLTY